MGFRRHSQRLPALQMIAYVMLVLIWVFALPGYVALRQHVFTDDEVGDHCRARRGSTGYATSKIPKLRNHMNTRQGWIAHAAS